MPSHHLETDEIFDYSTGAGPEWKALLTMCHLTLCPRCRSEVRTLDEIGGALLLEGVTRESFWALRGSRCPSTETGRAHGALAESWQAFAAKHGIPRGLGAFVVEERPRWRFFAPGVQEVPLSLDIEGTPARLLRFTEGFTIPRHDHEGDEWLLVFTGTIRDSESQIVFRIGDISRGGAGLPHEQYVGHDEPCVCLVLTMGSVIPATFLGRVLKRIAGI